MIQNSRLNGDKFEYSFICCILDKFPQISFGDKVSEKRYQILKDKIGSKQYEIALPQLFFRMKPTVIYIRQDNLGKQGCSDDIELASDTESYGFSLTHNNFSIKHPRPSSIYNHCDIPTEYHDDYVKFNNNWQKYCKKKGYVNFSDMISQEKDQMYMECLELLKKYLVKNVQIYKLITFCLCHEQQYVLHLEKTHRKMSVNHVTNIFNEKDSCSVEIKQPGNTGIHNTLIINIGNHSFSFRLHTAAKQIKKSLDLKYDVTCLTDLYHKIEEVCVKCITYDQSYTQDLHTTPTRELHEGTPALGSSSSGCLAYTKKGHRCKNNCKYRGYCHIHQRDLDHPLIV